MIQSTPPVQSIEPVKEQISQDASAETQDESNYITFKAPIIGTFEDLPEKDAFVSVGDTVSGALMYH